jgi:hypothetical protein
VLFPALLVGLGGTGLAVLRRLRLALHALVPQPRALAHLRFLYLDTDPDAARSAVRGSAETGLGVGEAMLLRLNRPSHYLRPRDNRPEVGAWLDPTMLYRIPRTQTTAGCRALGRLAFCDNYRLVAQRLRAELEACADPEPVQAAARQTRLGLRVTRPRVYVIASLAGGTGSGMFLDLAYVTRAALAELGRDGAELVGLFLLPPADRAAHNPLPLGNACAALTELGHFWRGERFSACYLVRDGTVERSEPPFGRCVLLPLAPGSGAAGDGAAAAAEFLARDLCTVLGRTADQARAAAARPSGGPYCQTFGLYKLEFPRRALVARAARRLCRGLVGRWMSKDGEAVRQAVRAWVAEHWPRDEYGPEGVIERLQSGCQRALGEPPERLFARLIEPVAGRAALDAAVLSAALARLEEQVGRPAEETLADQPFRFRELLRDAGDQVVEQWDVRVCELMVRLIESPQFRLAGAEEAVREMSRSLQKVLDHHEPLARELGARAADTHGRVLALAAQFQKPGGGKGRQLPGPAEVQELLRCYAKWRYQSLVLQQVTRGLVSLRGLLSDELRDVNFCRARLTELARAFDERPRDGEPDGEGPGPDSPAAAPGRTLFPGGCATLDTAADHVLRGVTAEQVAELDEKVQAMIRQQFTALVHVCLGPANLLRNVEAAMQELAEALVKGSLASVNAAELFFAGHPEEGAAEEAVAAAYEEAAPELAGRGGEVCVLVVPPGPAGARFRDLARRALPDVPLVGATGGDDVLFYREAAQVPFADLGQLGPIAREAYAQLKRREHFTPHCRTDIEFTVSSS